MKTKTSIAKSVSNYKAVQKAMRDTIEKLRKETEKAEKEKTPT